MKSAKYAGYVAITAGSELKGGHLMKHANINDIPTYLRLCGRQHKRKYSAIVSGSGTMNERTRRMFSLRMSGYSWKEIARILRTTANSAQVLFNYGLEKARSRVMKSKDAISTSGEGGEDDA